MTTSTDVSHRVPPLAPPGACDTHVHVFDPQRFPYAVDRRYTPASATVPQLQDLNRALGIERVVLVQPSVYNDDNRCLLSALEAFGNQARAVAVIDPAVITADEIGELAAQGVVGVRVNLQVAGESRAEAAATALAATLDRVADAGLMVQMYTDISVIGTLAPLVARAPVPVVFDHFGGVSADGGLHQDGLTALLDLLASGKAWVKLSAPYRVSQVDDFADLSEIVTAMVTANPARLLWASDWPHTGGGADRANRSATDIEPFRIVDNAQALRRLRAWVGNDHLYRQVLVDNPAALYGF